MLHTFSVYAYNRQGVLSRVTSLFRRRGFNIESFSVSHAERPGVSRMTIGVEIEPERAQLVEANLYKLVDVTLVETITDSMMIAQDLALIRVRGGIDLAIFLPALMDEFHVRIINRSPESLVLELTGTPKEVDSLVERLRPCGILDLVRSGPVVMATGPKLTSGRKRHGDRFDAKNTYPEVREAADSV